MAVLSLFTGLALFLSYLARADAGCAGAQPRPESACYSVEFLGFIPIARAELSSNKTLHEGHASLEMKVTPVGLAASLAKGSRFELSSAFNPDDGRPQEFALSLFDRNGLRYSKTSYYDFERRILRFEKSYPPHRNKKKFVKEFSLAEGSLSPLSAFYLMTLKAQASEELKIQVQDIPYTARAQGSESDGGKSISTYAVGKDMGRVEPWRRRMDMDLSLSFSCPAGVENGQGCLPFRAALPLKVVTLTAVEKTTLSAMR